MDIRVVVIVTLASACGFDMVPEGGDGDDTVRVGERQRAATATDGQTQQLDLLVVVDNSGSMREEQASLRDNFHLLINQLASLPGGLPDLHIGVISTDLGAGPFGIQECIDSGDNGALLSGGGACSLHYGSYISDRVDPQTGDRVRNYDGDLKEVFACIGDLGTTGCGFEQPLEAVKRALYENSANAGFLRPGAHLAVVILADEDDCSVADTEMFNTSQDSIGSPLGFLSSFRCSEFGLTCDGASVARSAATYLDCVPREDSPYMTHPDEYVDLLRGLKGNTKNVIVSVIAGNRTGLEVTMETDPGSGQTEPWVAPSCTSSNGEATPAYRLGYFAEQFEHNLVTSICQPDLSGVMTLTGDAIETAMRSGFADPEEEEEAGDDGEDGGAEGGCNAGGGRPAAAWGVIGLLLIGWRRRRLA